MEYLRIKLNTGRCCSLALAALLHYRKERKKQKNYRNLLAMLTYLLRQSLSLLCSLTLAIFFITEKNGKNRKITKTFACGRRIQP
jgi:hypothetical protein